MAALPVGSINTRLPTPNAQRPTPNARQRPTPNAQRPTPNAQRPNPSHLQLHHLPFLTTVNGSVRSGRRDEERRAISRIGERALTRTSRRGGRRARRVVGRDAEDEQASARRRRKAARCGSILAELGAGDGVQADVEVRRVKGVGRDHRDRMGVLRPHDDGRCSWLGVGLAQMIGVTGRVDTVPPNDPFSDCSRSRCDGVGDDPEAEVSRGDDRVGFLGRRDDAQQER